MPPCPKPNHKRKAPKQKIRNDFSDSVKVQVRKRSKGVCEHCNCRVATQYHHVYPRSRMGRGVYTNCYHVCNDCHTMIHRNVATMLEMLIEKYEQMYGKRFYKDEWDV